MIIERQGGSGEVWTLIELWESTEAARARTSRRRSGPRSGSTSRSRRRRADVHPFLFRVQADPHGCSSRPDRDKVGPVCIRSALSEKTGSTGTTGARLPEQGGSARARPDSAGSSWDPDLILEADVGRDGKPLPPADPQWQADLILDDETSSQNRPVQPLDPNWRPAVVFLDETAGRDSTKSHRATGNAAEKFRSLFERISARSRDETTVNWQSPWIRTIGILIFVALFIGNIWLCFNAWNAEPDPVKPYPTADHGTPVR